MRERCFVCHSCSKRVEHTSEERPCQVLSGWLTVAHWKSVGAVEHYHFCSLSCLKSWTDAQIPQVPEVFLKAFNGEEAK